MSDDNEIAQLQQLAERIDAKKRLQESLEARENAPATRSHNMSDVIRVMSELVSGLVVGCFVGYWLDRWLDTSPWLFLVCFCFGAAASFLTIIRTSQRQRTE